MAVSSRCPLVRILTVYASQLFADMGVLPATPIASMVIDQWQQHSNCGGGEPIRRPESSLPFSEVTGVDLIDGTLMVRGQATAQGARVASVEVCCDGDGTYWYPARAVGDSFESGWVLEVPGWEERQQRAAVGIPVSPPRASEVKSRAVDDNGWFLS